MKSLLDDYRKKRSAIQSRLGDFSGNFKKSDEDVFAELCFCLLTPQSKAVICDKAISSIRERGLLLDGNCKEIKSQLRGVRFPNNKARYLIEARKVFKNGDVIDIKNCLDTNDLIKTRDWLVKNVKGIGYKEASHFLRNIGLGNNLAILDRHILKNLKRYGIIRTIPKTLTRKRYLMIEQKMRNFFRKLNIPIEEIDLLFWSKETGMIFK